MRPKLTMHPKRLLGDLRRLIEAARRRTAQFVNAELVKLYWSVGDRIRRSAEHVELLRLEESGIRVAEYLTELPPRPLLEKKLQEAIQVAQNRFSALPEWTG